MFGPDYSLVLPEIILAVGAMALLMLGAYRGEDRQASTINALSAGLLFIVGLWICFRGDVGGIGFGGAYVADGFSRFAKVLILFSSALVLLLSEDWFTRRGIMKFEFPILVVLACVGMLVMASSADLITLYMGLELQSFAAYVMAAINRDSTRSTEAGLKYFILGALASGLLLYGASLVYGYAGTTMFEGIGAIIAAEGVSIGLLFGLVFVCAALAFKISAAPFHMWTPDVYEGAPTPVTTFFATAPKVAAAVLFARVLYDGFTPAAAREWGQILVFISVASMYLGSIAAIGQPNLKRLLAYSAIGHMGYALVGLAAGTPEGASSLLIYLAIYMVMTLGVFAFILQMERDGQPVEAVQDLAGLSRTRPAQALAMGILMFSLAGLPPMVGFFAKFFVFKAAVDAGLWPLAVAAVIASVIGAYYYLNIVRVMYLSEPGRPLELRGRFYHAATLGGAAAIMALGWLPFLGGFGVPEIAEAAAISLLR